MEGEKIIKRERVQRKWSAARNARQGKTKAAIDQDGAATTNARG